MEKSTVLEWFLLKFYQYESMNDLESVALTIFDAIFSDADDVEIEGVHYPIDVTARAKVRAVSIDPYFFVEQNPRKSSQWADKARQGHQIIWVMEGRKYLARVMDRKFLDLRKGK